ncbi:MAG: GNAT family N-acetyltransferase [Lentisphaerae bacterium]|nr:GNAT family N-acetyltransferase [Lentisphaerota bacterium]
METASNPRPPAHRIRDAVPEDVPALDQCYPADHAARIRRADGRNARYLVVETAAGEVVGFGRLTLDPPTWMGRQGNRANFINNLNVREDMRGRGFGTALIRAMEEMARAAGCTALHMGVKKDNEKVLSLYTRLGYQECSRYGDRVLLVKRLASGDHGKRPPECPDVHPGR